MKSRGRLSGGEQDEVTGGWRLDGVEQDEEERRAGGDFLYS
jgi:hypothetical protein